MKRIFLIVGLIAIFAQAPLQGAQAVKDLFKTSTQRALEQQLVLNQQFLEVVREGKIGPVRDMLNQEPKPDINYLSPNDESPLLIAIHRGSLEIVELLISNSVNLNKPNSKGITALYKAVGLAGKSLEIKNQGFSAFLGAFLFQSLQPRSTYIKLLNIFLQHTIDINTFIPEVGTPLIVAAVFQDIEVMQLLIQKGADTTIKLEGKTAQEFITDPQKANLLQIIIQKYKATTQTQSSTDSSNSNLYDPESEQTQEHKN